MVPLKPLLHVSADSKTTCLGLLEMTLVECHEVRTPLSKPLSTSKLLAGAVQTVCVVVANTDVAFISCSLDYKDCWGARLGSYHKRRCKERFGCCR